jgi:hypothetical protein
MQSQFRRGRESPLQFFPLFFANRWHGLCIFLQDTPKQRGRKRPYVSCLCSVIAIEPG